MSPKIRWARTAGLLLSWFLPVCSLAAADQEKIARLSFGDAIDSALRMTTRRPIQLRSSRIGTVSSTSGSVRSAVETSGT